MSDPENMSDPDQEAAAGPPPEDESDMAESSAPEAPDVDPDLAETPPPTVEPQPKPAPAPNLTPIQTPVRRRRRAKGDGDSWWELTKTVVYAVLIAVVVRTVFFQPFNIPSASMENTLLIGDYLFVSKYSYGYSLYSLPWGYWLRRHVALEGRIFGSEPERGDIVVFKYPPDNKTDYIKRTIGLPGDRIQMIDGVLYINGKAVPKVRVADYIETDEYGNTKPPVARYKETLPNGVSYYVLDRFDSAFDNTDVFVVPPGHYFMMGDNRDNSDDSRGHVGMVPFENLVGHARFIWWSVYDSMRLFEPWTWPGAIRYDRIATFVD